MSGRIPFVTNKKEQKKTASLDGKNLDFKYPAINRYIFTFEFWDFLYLLIQTTQTAKNGQGNNFFRISIQSSRLLKAGQILSKKYVRDEMKENGFSAVKQLFN